MNKKILYSLTGFLLLFVLSCNSTTMPKPKGFNRIDLPEENYIQFAAESYPVTFEMPSYVLVEPVVGSPDNEKWFNLVFKPFNAKLYITYTTLNNNLAMHLEQNHKLTYEHQVKATAIRSHKILYPERNVFGLQYTLKGNVATPIQFYLTDSTQHFLRASLYFEYKANYDSISPILERINYDLLKFVETLNWAE